jgi:hypothetical protein
VILLAGDSKKRRDADIAIARGSRPSGSGVSQGLLQEGVECLLAGDVDTGKVVLRDYINATIGFGELSQVFDKSSKSFMRMFWPKGIPRRATCLRLSDTCMNRRDAPGSQSPEGRLGCCVSVFNRQFFRAV